MSECKCGQEATEPDPKQRPMIVCDSCKATLKISKADFIARLNHIDWLIYADYFKGARKELENLKKELL